MKLCPYPFSRLEISNYEGRADFLKGRFLPCVPSWFKDDYFEIENEKELDAIWNGKAAQLLRQKMYEGDFSFCNRSACQIPLLTIEEMENGHNLFKETPVGKKNLEAIKRKDPMMPEGPASLSLTSDFSCNLKCPICRDSLIPNRPTRAALEEKEFLLKNKETIEVIKLSNGGEVFYSTLQRQLLKSFNELEWPRLKRLHIVSNGTLFSKKTYEELYPGSAFIKDITISIDAGTKDVYEKMRGPHWEQLLINLSFLSDLRKKGIVEYLSFHAIVVKDNFRDIPNIVALGEKFKVDRVLLQPYNNGPDQGYKNYEEQAIQFSTHPDHQEFLDMLYRFRDHPLVYTYFNIKGYEKKIAHAMSRTTLTLNKENWKVMPEDFKRYHHDGKAPRFILAERSDEHSLLNCSGEEKEEIIQHYLSLADEYAFFLEDFDFALRPLLQKAETPRLKKLKVMWELKVKNR